MLKIVYIAAAPRSGTTLLGNILGSLPGVAHVGELDLAWRKAPDHDERLCGCGQPLAACPVWASALRTVEAFHKRVDLSGDYNAVLAWERYLPRGTPEQGAYLDAIAEAYRRVAESSGAGVLVDSSKRPSYAACLRRIPTAEVRVIHLVRDPRAFVYSRQRRIKKERRGGRFALDLPRAALDLYRWRRINQEAAALSSAGPYLRLRYEDLVAEPERALGEVAAFAGVDARGLGRDGSVRLETSHTYKGNANRFRTGEVALVEDLRWRRELTGTSRALLRGMAAPMAVL